MSTTFAQQLKRLLADRSRIERVSGLSYFDFVRQHIFEKVQMTRSDFVSLDGVDAEVAEGYVPVMDNTIVG